MMMIDDATFPVVAPNWDWQSQAACRGLGDTLFYPPAYERGTYKRLREHAAKAVCATCPVAVACLAWALSTGEPHGVWGGLTEAERIALTENQRDARLREG